MLDSEGVNTWVIGLGFAPYDAALDAIAIAGGTGPHAIYLDVDLAVAIKGIIDSL
jgi:hypothetical protein